MENKFSQLEKKIEEMKKNKPQEEKNQAS